MSFLPIYPLSLLDSFMQADDYALPSRRRALSGLRGTEPPLTEAPQTLTLNDGEYEPSIILLYIYDNNGEIVGTKDGQRIRL